jgi:hypothetical protein
MTKLTTIVILVIVLGGCEWFAPPDRPNIYTMENKVDENFVRSKNNGSLIDTLIKRVNRLEEKRKPNIWESRVQSIYCGNDLYSFCADGHLWDVIHGGWYCLVGSKWEPAKCPGNELSFCDKEGKCSRKFTITGIEENVSCD